MALLNSLSPTLCRQFHLFSGFPRAALYSAHPAFFKSANGWIASLTEKTIRQASCVWLLTHLSLQRQAPLTCTSTYPLLGEGRVPPSWRTPHSGTSPSPQSTQVLCSILRQSLSFSQPCHAEVSLLKPAQHKTFLPSPVSPFSDHALPPSLLRQVLKEMAALVPFSSSSPPNYLSISGTRFLFPWPDDAVLSTLRRTARLSHPEGCFSGLHALDLEAACGLGDHTLLGNSAALSCPGHILPLILSHFNTCSIWGF